MTRQDRRRRRAAQLVLAFDPRRPPMAVSLDLEAPWPAPPTPSDHIDMIDEIPADGLRFPPSSPSSSSMKFDGS